MDRIKELVKIYIAPDLKSHGFKKRAHKWKRERGEIVDIIQVVSSKWNSLNDESCHIEYGVCVPSFHSLIWSEKLDDFPIEADAVFKGSLKKNIKFEANEDIKNKGLLLKQILINDIIPELEKFIDYHSLYHHLELMNVMDKRYPLDKIHYCLLKKEIGHIDEAKATYKAIMDDSNKVWSEKVNGIFQELF